MVPWSKHHLEIHCLLAQVKHVTKLWYNQPSYLVVLVQHLMQSSEEKKLLISYDIFNTTRHILCLELRSSYFKRVTILTSKTILGLEKND